jgi:hypothetical protein
MNNEKISFLRLTINEPSFRNISPLSDLNNVQIMAV